MSGRVERDVSTRSIIFLALSETNGNATGGIIWEAVGLEAFWEDSIFCRCRSDMAGREW